MIFKNSLSASWLVRKLSSPRLDCQRVGLSVNCPVSDSAHAQMRSIDGVVADVHW